MKTIKIFAMAFATTAILAPCVKETGGNTNPNDNEDRTVKIKITKAGEATRAETANKPDGDQMNFNDGYLVFYNAGKAITKVITILPYTAAEQDFDADSGTVGINAIQQPQGEWITGVPGASTMVCLIANYQGAAPEVGDDITAIKDKVANQYNDGEDGGTAGDALVVVAYGEGPLTKAAADPNPATGPDGGALDENDYEANLLVSPIAARIQIHSIAGTPSGNAETFTYQIDGIFVDKYYDEMYINGTAIGSSLKSNLREENHYVPGNIGSSYTLTPENMTGIVFDYDPTNGIAYTKGDEPEDMKYSPGDGKVWAYNLLAPTKASTSAPTAITMPAIIISVSNVVVDGAEWPGQYYLTIQNFRRIGQDETIKALQQSHIYNIRNVNFTEADLDDLPYESTKDVYVTVQLMTWVAEEVEVDFDELQ
jgi:hypothetical protein